MTCSRKQDANPRLHISTSGYQYPHWKGRFYPHEIARKDWLHFYAEQFNTVEINNTFYGLPEASTFDTWRKQAPPGFVYALKYSRYGSHIKKLKDPGDHINTFLSAAERLGSFMGPILVQLPPKWRVDPTRLACFLKTVPQKHRWAVEFRDPSWLCEEIFRILGKHHAALCIHDMIEDHPRVITADWAYFRYHGPRDGGNYSSQWLTAEADRITELQNQGLEVFAFFNNDQQGYAPANARDLRRYVQKRLTGD